MKHNLLFVYGTLRKDGHLHHRYMQNLIKSVDITIKGIKLYYVDYTPVAVITNRKKNKLVGELYLATTKQLKRIDALESGYSKVLLNMTIDGFEKKQDVIIYVKSMKTIPKDATRIKHGDWSLFESIEDEFENEQYNTGDDDYNVLNEDYDEVNAYRH